MDKSENKRGPKKKYTPEEIKERHKDQARKHARLKANNKEKLIKKLVKLKQELDKVENELLAYEIAENI